MKQIISILFFVITFFYLWSTAEGQVRINEIRANDNGSDDAEFIELIGIAGTDLSGYEIVHVNGSGGGTIFSHTIGSFLIPDDGITDTDSNNLGFYVLGVGEFSAGTDETTASTNSSLQNGVDGIILYDDEGNVSDAVAWEGAGDINGDVTTTGSPYADNFLHVVPSDEGNDNSLQAPNDVVGDDGSGWNVLIPTIGAVNSSQISGSIILIAPIKAEPMHHITSFTSTGGINSVNLSWTDATGNPTADAYLIKANETDFESITAPTDGHAISNDVDLSDGAGALHVNFGEESASFSGLAETTTYYFKIFPYTNTGLDIDYKTNGTVPQVQATTLEIPPITLNEFLADPAGDANKDGTVSSDDDEFLEFANTGNSDLDMSGWSIEDANGTTYTFPASTVLKPRQGIIIFGGGNPTGGFGGSIVKTTSSLSLNNNGDDIVLKNDSGIEIISYSFGSEANNDKSMTRNPDLTGTFEDHTSTDMDDGSAFSPGVRIDGSTFQPSVTFKGGEGWRMLSTPTSANSYQDLLHNIWTQCSANSDYNGSLCTSDPDTQPNVLIYDGTDFVNAGDLDDAGSNHMIPGQGFIVYVYNDDDFDESPDNSGFPKTLNIFGELNSGNINASLHSGNGTWTLAGNPYNESIDWDKLDTSDLYGTVYVYDHTYGTINGGGDDISEGGNVGGGYRTYNGNSGSLTNGIIAPFQGFWVQNAGSNHSLIFQESAKTTGGTFYTKDNEQVASVRLRSEMKNMYNEAFLSFTEFGDIHEDRFDGLKLSPLDHRNYMSLSTDVDGTQMDINNLPIEFFEPIEIPLHVQAFETVEPGWTQMGGEVTLSWPEMTNIPAEWEITLTDSKLNRNVNLRDSKKYIYQKEASLGKINGKEPFTPFNPVPLKKEKAVNAARFLITINPNVPDGMLTMIFQLTLCLNKTTPTHSIQPPTSNLRLQKPVMLY